MSDTKPLEWLGLEDGLVAIAECQECNSVYIARKTTAKWFPIIGPVVFYPIPGPYDGTIETAKQRCEEHRRKQA